MALFIDGNEGDEEAISHVPLSPVRRSHHLHPLLPLQRLDSCTHAFPPAHTPRVTQQSQGKFTWEGILSFGDTKQRNCGRGYVQGIPQIRR